MREILIKGEGILAELLRDAGVAIAAPCGGHGRCGKCRVVAHGALSEPTVQEKKTLTAEELADGVRLACCAMAQGEVRISLPEEQVAKVRMDGASFGASDHCAYQKLGVAIDIGTTTLASQLYEGGKLLASAGMANPQRAFGADVISRIESALGGHAAEQAQVIREALSQLMVQLCEEAGRSLEDIDGVCITGNTTMLYLLTGTDTEPLSHAPFVITEYFGRSIPAERLDLPCPKDTAVYLPRCMGPFVGADITCAALASGLCERDQTGLLADIGTNGELALWHQDNLYCTSTAAGPAFEAANLSCGMQGSAGAVDHATVKDGAIDYHVIGDVEPKGICGSGIADLIACMLRLELIDETGYLTDDEDEYPLTDSVCVSQQDIRQIQLAKSAVCAGMLTMMDYAGIGPEDVAQLDIAGGFGSYLSLDSAVDIGLIPKELKEGSRVIGNAALSGAAMLLHDTALWEKANKLAQSAQQVDLAANPVFMDNYIENMQFDC